ncbi:MAG: hypothetical protein KDA16_03010 [Phycisphaerales bacterium]|nr:hypothetical protein [Phycisphaerales bacterium]
MIGSTDLLRKLASGVQPDGTHRTSAPEAIERERFEGLLARIRDGGLGSGRPVRLSGDASIELDDEQTSRLSDATDAAQAAGYERLLACIDQHVLRVDVAQREANPIESRADSGLLTGFDAAVVISKEPEDVPRIVQRPSGLRNAALGELLARDVRSGEGAATISRAAE